MGTLALCVICKNEIKNLPRLLDSVSDCFDEIHITDTGSTDGTIEYLQDLQKNGEVQLHHFTWINDFAAARNYSFSHACTDYSMWLDCDDVLVGKEAFLEWKKNLLPTANYWFATYHYGLDKEGNPNCSFVRERVIKNNVGFKWQYFVHEGIPPVCNEPLKVQYAASWEIKHLRTEEDIKVDKNRNLSIFESRKDSLDSRMQYYYGKELYEAGKYLEAYQQLTLATEKHDLEIHDRVLGLQYAVCSAIFLNQFEKAIELAQKGLKYAPNRAEFYVSIGDAYLKLGQFDNAIPSYAAAAHCINSAPPGTLRHTPLFTSAPAYTTYPRNQLARIAFNKGDIQLCQKYLDDAAAFGADFETGQMMAELQKVKSLITVRPKSSLKACDEIVFSCLPIAPYKWDENIAKERGVGGSETACIEMARHLHKLTGKVVRVFNEREDTLELDGVVYEPNAKCRDYFSQNIPKVNIAWRHSVPLTEAPTYIWCHDLGTMGFEDTTKYEQVLCLSKFHKEYVKHLYKIPDEKIRVTRNGIDLSRFEGLDTSIKNPNKIVFSSSPDRGLLRAIAVVNHARQYNPQLELHAFYGVDNMLKLGLKEQADQIVNEVKKHHWVKFHGNVQQSQLVDHLKDAKVWLYPTDFLETYCITALEMLGCRVRPVVRQWGALPYTLSEQPACIVDMDCQKEAQIGAWALTLLDELKVEQPPVDLSRFSWESVAKEWLAWLPI